MQGRPAKPNSWPGKEVALLAEHSDDNRFGVAAGTIFGLKKTVFNSADFGTVLMPTYAVSH